MCRALRTKSGKIIKCGQPVITVRGTEAVWTGCARVESWGWWKSITTTDYLEVDMFWEADSRRPGHTQGFTVGANFLMKAAITTQDTSTHPAGSLLVWTQPTLKVDPRWVEIHHRFPVLIRKAA